MKKIPSLFMRNYDGDRLVRDEVVPGCEWVLNGEGIATRKWDGTSCLVKDGKLYKRYDAKNGRCPTPGFVPCEEAPDPVTGHWPGWVPIGDGPADRWHKEAWDNHDKSLPDGTYELIGPKVQGNPEERSVHCLVKHGELPIYPMSVLPLTNFDRIRAYLAVNKCEGIVWHHPDGRMCKIKRKDFGFPWPVKNEQ